MNIHSNSNTHLVSALLCISILSGCANLAPIRTFSDETKKLSAAFEPMLAGSASSCTEKYKRKKMITSTNFDPVIVEKDAKELCSSINEDNKIIGDINSLLEQYADTLATLADNKLPSYKTELNGLKDSLGKLKKPDTQDVLIDSKKLGAITSLTDFLSRIATQRLQNSAIRDLIGHENAINAIASTLSDYATLNYKAWLNDELKEIRELQKMLKHFSKTEPLATNYIKALLLTEERQIQERAKAVDAFVKAVSALKKSNSDLNAKLDHLDDKELIDQLIGFAKEVSDLRKKINETF